ncbi:hypothetical protein ABEB36_000594 [Hypothenemus hampei]
MTELEKLGDLNKICRICLKEDNILLNLFDSKFFHIITSVTSLVLKQGDFWPENICQSCRNKFSEFYKFKQFCEKNNELLKSLISVKLANQNKKEYVVQGETGENEIEYVEEEVAETICQSNDSSPYYNNGPLTDNKVWCKDCHSHIESSNIEIHKEEYHPKNDSHFCYICSKDNSSTYKTAKQLRAHIKYHRQIPKFQCEFCHKWFRLKHQKMVHMRIHTGERPATCNLCDKSFRDPKYLRVHSKSHTGEKPYKCSICEKRFAFQFTLNVHMKSHSAKRENMCSVCGKTFIYLHTLRIHSRVHTGERPYRCKLCFSSFISASVLNAHMLIHSDQKR